MLHTETVSPATLELLKHLMNDSRLQDFALVGGTALALQMGHRISVDLDLFSPDRFDEMELSAYLAEHYSLELDFLAHGTIKGEIRGVKVDCIVHRYPWISVHHVEEGIRLASFADISAMKLNAIAVSGTRVKDFIDIACLSSRLSLDEMLRAYEQKYRANVLIPLKALTYWEDICFDEPVRMLNADGLSWENVRKRLLEMQECPDKVWA